MSDYSGANNPDKMTGNLKEAYSKKIKFKKLRKLLGK